MSRQHACTRPASTRPPHAQPTTCARSTKPLRWRLPPQGCPMSRCDVGISTIRCEKTPFSEAFEDFLRKEDAPYHFVSGKPYKVAERPNNVAHDIQSRNKVQYLGVEIRSDLIDTPKKRTDMARYIGEGINHVLSQPNIQEIMAPWESKSKPRVPESDIVQIWM